LATLVYFACLNVFTYLLDVSPVVSAILSYSLSLGVSFVGQSRLTFRASGAGIATMMKFVANSLLGLAIHAGFVHVAVSDLHINQNIGAIAATIVATAISYFLMRHWIFPQKA
jgi:putative flippase GtrA